MDVSTIKNFRLHDALCYLFGEEHSSKWDLELSDPNVGVIATRWDMEEAFPSQTILDSVYAELIKQDLLTNKTAYKRLVDEQAGEARKKYITDTAGQSQVYIFKLAEAKRYKDAVTGGATSFDTNEYPYLYAELGITGSSIMSA